ncbi:MAG: class I SAM-dependent methyltransferase, partial [Gammaproteobacteria bacterium]|nr:class I SAM-dependent methyltransferase [Gammaproteobacteria bacterium]
QDFVPEDGVIQMNDCCHSKDGLKQNLGVLEATVKFLKMSEFVPVLTTNTDYTDVLLARRNSKLINVIDTIVNVNDINYVEVPSQLLGALTIKSGRRVNPSFC